MLKNYIIIALRNLFRHKTISIIHLVGFTVSIALCLLLFTYVQHELSYDQFHEKSERIYRITQENKDQEGVTYAQIARTPYILADVLESEMPEAERLIRLFAHSATFKVENQEYHEPRVLTVHDPFLDVIQLPLEIGQPELALAEPYSVVISQRIVAKYFDDANPIGKTISSGDRNYTVTGVLDPLPQNTIFKFDLIRREPEMTRAEVSENYGAPVARMYFGWSNSNFQTFLVAREGYTADDMVQKINGIARKHTPDSWNNVFHAQTLREVYLFSQDYSAGSFPSGIGEYIFLYSGITIFLFLMACINFISLSLGLSSYRLKEVGMRKVIGAKRGQLVVQFLGEILVISLISVVFGYLLAELLLPAFSQFVDESLTMQFSWMIMLMIIAVTVLILLIAGYIPALIISKRNPVSIFRGQMNRRGGRDISKSLVVLQFMVAIFFIASAVIMTNQIKFIQQTDLGFDRENILILSTHGEVPADRLTAHLSNSVRENPDILAVSGSSYNLGISGGLSVAGRIDYRGRSLVFSQWGADYDFVKTLGIEMIQGRTFSRDYPGDVTKSIIVNEEFVREAKLDDPLSHEFRNKQIIGVFRNIHDTPLQRSIQPLVITHTDDRFKNEYIYVKTTGEQTEEAINWLRSKWSDIAPATLFEYHFLDDQFNANYRRYYTITNTMQFAGGSTIIIALMGVLGMTLLSVKKREQEISIRKVLGARITNILSLIVRQYLWFILFASIVAAPLAYFGMEYWLQNFAYRITVEYWMFLIPVGALLILTIAIVSLHSVKVASYDPAQTLRYE